MKFLPHIFILVYCKILQLGKQKSDTIFQFFALCIRNGNFKRFLIEKGFGTTRVIVTTPKVKKISFGRISFFISIGAR